MEDQIYVFFREMHLSGSWRNCFSWQNLCVVFPDPRYGFELLQISGEVSQQPPAGQGWTFWSRASPQ
jgi:hypothetical protein